VGGSIKIVAAEFTLHVVEQARPLQYYGAAYYATEQPNFYLLPSCNIISEVNSVRKGEILSTWPLSIREGNTGKF
jgi:hypothetical protein